MLIFVFFAEFNKFIGYPPRCNNHSTHIVIITIMCRLYYHQDHQDRLGLWYGDLDVLECSHSEHNVLS